MGGIDYIGESLGWPCHGWTGCPVDSAGFMKLRAYHLMSQWTDQPVIRIGVYDESEPWDMANRMWGFPQMSGHWNYDCNGKMMHIAVMTNCDTVELYLNDDVKRVAHPDAPDRLAHFYVDYRPALCARWDCATDSRSASRCCARRAAPSASTCARSSPGSAPAATLHSSRYG